MRSNQNIKALAVPIGFSITVSGLLLLAGFFSVTRITKQYDNLKQSRIEENVLLSKNDELSSVQIESLDASNRTLIAMPKENPGLFMVTQLKSMSAKYSLSVTDIQLEKESEYAGGMSRAKIVFVFESSDLNSVIAFFKELKTLSPLSTTEKIDINGNKLGNYIVESEIYVYWSDFPETLPPISDPIIKLTTSDQELLTRLSNLTVPAFTVLNPAEPVERTTPF
ncbi:hypothetical protein IPM62_02965 [Candidatus Woesebacteria bacterium]|nr:MAG: hypothetical protein IPM62_02965 [Candidatus Woesebacteria bacterium]